MPHQIPPRASKRDFYGDSPITEMGKTQAKFTGEALKTGPEQFNFQFAYVSPSLRSIQTAHHVLETMGLEKVCKLRIEPSLFEFLGWYEKGMPSFLSPETLINFGYNIDINYKPLITADKLQPDENYTDYYMRSFNLVKHMTNLHQREGKGVKIILIN
jgi:ubiquitin-associated SH3 domain-containing protein